MLTLIENLKLAAHKRAMYVKTRDEIARLPLAEAFDIGLHPLDAERIAYDAVYGKAA